MHLDAPLSAAVRAKIIDINGRASGRSRLWLEVIAVLIGLIFVILSGASVSAIRAFIKPLLVIFAILIDRRALTIRNFALAAFVILAINPVSVFGAGFQLSFAATAVLIMAYEKSLYRPPARWHRIIGYLIGILALQCWQISRQCHLQPSILAVLPLGEFWAT